MTVNIHTQQEATTMEDTDSTNTKDLPTIAADMLNAWYSPSNPHTWTAEDYRGLKHYGQRDFDVMVSVLSAALGGEQR